ncbi:MAG: hypothetical protein ACF8GE_02400 [Phycisphaerales bacterium JB043]
MRAMVVAVCVLLSTLPCRAFLLQYTFEGQVNENSMASGAFASADIGATTRLEILIDTSIPSQTSNATRQSWGGVPGVISSVVAQAGSVTRSFLPDAPTEADIWNDDLDHTTIPGNVIAVDSFRLRVDTLTNTDDMMGFIVDLSAISLGTTFATSSLSSTNWPTQSIELNPASFSNARFMGFFQDTTYSSGVFSELTSIAIQVIPGAPSTSLLACAGLVLCRRRR